MDYHRGRFPRSAQPGRFSRSAGHLPSLFPLPDTFVPAHMPRLARLSPQILGALTGVLPLLAWGQQQAAASAPPPGISGSSVLQALFGLLVVLGLLVAATFFMRRIYGGRPFGQGPLKLLGGIAVGNRERILLVEVEDTWLVIGMAPGQFRTLHTLPKGQLPQGLPGSPGQPSFAHWLNQVMARKNNPPE